MIYLALIITFITTIILLLWRRFTFWSRQGIRGFQFIELRSYINLSHEFIYEMSKKYGKVYGWYGITERSLVVNEPDLIKEILVKNSPVFRHRTIINLGPDPIVAKNLFFMLGDENYKRVRRIISPAFTSGKLKEMMSDISGISENLLINLEKFEQKGHLVDMSKYIGGYAMNVISACGYGIKIDSINNPEHPFVVNAKGIFGVNANLSQILSFVAPKLAKYLNLNFFDPIYVKYFRELTNQIVNEREFIDRSNRGKGKKRRDFFQLMIDSQKIGTDFGNNSNSDEEMPTKNLNQNKLNNTLTRDEITAQLVLFLSAGYDTTTATLSHLVFYLCQYKECQQRLYEELKDIEDFSYENLCQLKYMNAVIDETLRLAPPILRIQRVNEENIEILGIKIPKGTFVEVLPYALHRDPDYWPEPLEFKPERFLQPKHNPWAYLPFGGGPRICIAQTFALNEMRMCCAKLFNKFEFNLAPGFEKLEYFKGSFLLSPKNVMVNLKSR